MGIAHGCMLMGLREGAACTQACTCMDCRLPRILEQPTFRGLCPCLIRPAMQRPSEPAGPPPLRAYAPLPNLPPTQSHLLATYGGAAIIRRGPP
jgi:hypothetical protein